MDYEKKYKEAFELMKDCIPDEDGLVHVRPCDIFPELAESEDEEVRRELLLDIPKVFPHDKAFRYIAYLEKQGENAKFRDSIQVGDKVTRNQDGMLVNLSQLNRVAKKDEKQSEQKPVDKVEPKFKVGDWVVLTAGELTSILKIEAIDAKKKKYYFDDYSFLPIVDEDSLHLWTIQDAKDGDVLHSIGFHNDCIFIFNGLDNWKFDEPNGDRAVATGYCCLFVSADNIEFGIQGPDCVEVNTIKPATKIQRDLLFQKMKEYGYEWDAEKKELKKVEQNPEERESCESWSDEQTRIKLLSFVNTWGKAKLSLTGYNRFVNYLEKQGKQKSAEWSEEDEDILYKAISVFNKLCAKREEFVWSAETLNKIFWWLKSLKERVQPQNIIVTDEELVQVKKDAYNDALDKIEYHSGEPTFDDGWSAAIDYIRKKFLMPQTTWKPSDEQIYSLDRALRFYGKGTAVYDSVKELLEQLKKLKE